MRSAGPNRTACWLMLAVAAGGAAGCSVTSGSAAGVALRIEPRRTRIMAGETVTILTRAVIDPATDATIRWRTDDPAATVEAEQDGRVARITFDRPGTHRVDAALVSGGRELRRARTTIEVTASP